MACAQFKFVVRYGRIDDECDDNVFFQDMRGCFIFLCVRVPFCRRRPSLLVATSHALTAFILRAG